MLIKQGKNVFENKVDPSLFSLNNMNLNHHYQDYVCNRQILRLSGSGVFALVFKHTIMS